MSADKSDTIFYQVNRLSDRVWARPCSAANKKTHRSFQFLSTTSIRPCTFYRAAHESIFSSHLLASREISEYERLVQQKQNYVRRFQTAPQKGIHYQYCDKAFLFLSDHRPPLERSNVFHDTKWLLESHQVKSKYYRDFQRLFFLQPDHRLLLQCSSVFDDTQWLWKVTL